MANLFYHFLFKEDNVKSVEVLAFMLVGHIFLSLQILFILFFTFLLVMVAIEF